METVTSKETAVAPAEPVGTQLMTLDPKTYVAQVFAPFTERLAAAKAAVAEIKEIDVSTKQGMAIAVRHRATFRAIRIEAENARVFRKAPILTIGRLLDSRNGEIHDEVTKEEERFDSAIKADERRKEEERMAKIRAEQERVAAEEKARKDAEEKRLADERAELARQHAELERQKAEQRELAAKTLREQQERERKIEDEERAARLRVEEQDRAARATREQADREALEKQQRNQDALSEIQGIQQQVIIAQIGRAGVRSGGTIECIRETLAETEAWDMNPVRFGFFAQTAAKEKDKAVASIRALLALAEKREADDARLKAKLEVVDKHRQEAEAAQRRALEEEEAKAAAERRAQEDRERAERDRLEAEARAKAEEERGVRQAAEAQEREAQRQHQRSLDGRDALVSFVNRFGDDEEFADVTADIKEFLADVPNAAPAVSVDLARHANRNSRPG